MPAYQYYTADVFTSQQFGGNQLAVFPDGRGLDATLMQRIAREFNFSETTFVLPPDDPAHTRRVRIFTPGSELPFAGHPTVGTAFVLATIGEIALTGDETRIVFEQKVGPVPVTIRSAAGKPDFAQLSVAQLPVFGPPPPDARDLAGALGLDASDILDGDLRPEGVSCGLPYLCIPVRSRAALARAYPKHDQWNAVFGGYWSGAAAWLFCAEPELPGSHHRARMFAPDIGVVEDPATGSACASFGGYLGARERQPNGRFRWRVEQGFELGRPSLLDVEVDKRDGAITAVRVGGNSVLVSKGEFYV